MTELINKRIMLGLLAELTAVWPSRLDPAQQVTRAQVYRDALIGFDEDAVRHAVKRAIQEDSFFPKPARLREIAQSYVAYHRRSESGTLVDSSRCAVCGEDFRYRTHWRPAATKAPIRWFVSSCGRYLLLERFERYLCGCAPPSHYVPDPELLGGDAVPVPKRAVFHMPFTRTSVVITAAAEQAEASL